MYIFPANRLLPTMLALDTFLNDVVGFVYITPGCTEPGENERRSLTMALSVRLLKSPGMFEM